jgi:hypothetical protein
MFPLWLILSCKPINPELLNPEKSLADRIKLRGDNFEEFAEWLNSGDKVSEHFPVSLETPYVQVIAQIVPESEPVYFPFSCTSLTKTPSTRFVHPSTTLSLFCDIVHHVSPLPLTLISPPALSNPLYVFYLSFPKTLSLAVCTGRW